MNFTFPEKDILFKPVEEGGLGICPAGLVNRSLVCKKLWRIISPNEAPFLLNNLREKYNDWRKTDFIRKPYTHHQRLRNNHSQSEVEYWYWIIYSNQAPIMVANAAQLINLRKTDFIRKPYTHHQMHSPRTWNPVIWNVQLLKLLYDVHTCDQIQKMPISLMNGEDKIVWHLSSRGTYSAKEGFKVFLSTSFTGTIDSSYPSGLNLMV